jgi:ectoine hydroxylase-related dioxygenase (phytanoyl-CoA dioxygenase family)
VVLSLKIKSMRAVFKNKELEEHFIKHGYCVVRLLEPSDLQKLEEIYYTNRVEEQAAIERTTSTTNIELGRNIRRQAGEVVGRRASQVLSDYRVLFSGFVTKIPGKPSKMRLHQDPTFVDETQFKALNIWSPLVDVDEKNGAVWIVPNSDKFFHGFRGQPAKEFDFDEISTQVMNKLGQMIPMKAGEALIYDTTLFHFSLENASGKIRIANASVMIPEEATPIYYHHNKALDTLDVYEINEDFMLRYYSEYLKTGVVEEKLLSRVPYQSPKKISFAEFEEKYHLYNPSKQS